MLPTLPPEVLSLLDRVAARPSGFQLLCRGDLESIAVLFSAHPSVVDTVRGWLGRPDARAAVVEALVHARRNRPAAGGVQPAQPPVPLHPPAPDAEGLLAAVAGFPSGEELLFEASLETVAILFGAHPFVVSEAREILLRRGCAPPAGEAPDPR